MRPRVVIYTGSPRLRKTVYGRVPEWPMGTDCKSAAFQLRWFESTRAHQEIQYPNRVLDFLFCRLFSGLGGWIRTASARRTVRRAKKPQWGFFRCAARDIHPRPQKPQRIKIRCGFCFVTRLNSLGEWIQTANKSRAQRMGLNKAQ